MKLCGILKAWINGIRLLFQKTKNNNNKINNDLKEQFPIGLTVNNNNDNTTSSNYNNSTTVVTLTTAVTTITTTIRRAENDMSRRKQSKPRAFLKCKFALLIIIVIDGANIICVNCMSVCVYVCFSLTLRQFVHDWCIHPSIRPSILSSFLLSTSNKNVLLLYVMPESMYREIAMPIIHFGTLASVRSIHFGDSSMGVLACQAAVSGLAVLRYSLPWSASCVPFSAPCVIKLCGVSALPNNTWAEKYWA